MSAIKDGRYPITLDKERHLLFSLNAIDEVQDRFGDIGKLSEVMGGKDKVKTIRWLLTMLINEGADEGEDELSERQVGRMVHVGNLTEISNEILKAFSVGTRGTDAADDEDADDEPKNA